MARKSREENKWVIPSDWNEETDGFQLAVLCIPNSREWRGVFVGQISDLAYGRNWNKKTGVILDVQLIAREIFESMSMTCLDDLITALQCICEQNTIMAAKTAEIAQAIDALLSDGVVSVGPGEQFPDQGAYFDAKCNVSNAIFDTLRDMFQWLQDNSTDLLAGILGGVMSGLVLGLDTSGPVGWAVAKIDSALTAIASFVVNANVGFQDVVDALDDTQTECVRALFNANDSLTARTNFIAAVEDGLPPITAADSRLVNLLLTGEMLNQLFDPRSDLAGYQSPAPVDCGSALLQLWTFPVDQESWTFRDDSSANASATGSYNSSEEALQIDHIIVAGGTFRTTRGVIVSPTIAEPITPGASVQWDYGAPSDAIIIDHKLTVIYTDATSEEIQGPNTTSAGTLVLTLTESKSIETIEGLVVRSNGSSTEGFSFTQLTFEVRVYSA